jgi:hypothetical protein
LQAAMAASALLVGLGSGAGDGVGVDAVRGDREDMMGGGAMAAAGGSGSAWIIAKLWLQGAQACGFITTRQICRAVAVWAMGYLSIPNQAA